MRYCMTLHLKGWQKRQLKLKVLPLFSKFRLFWRVQAFVLSYFWETTPQQIIKILAKWENVISGSQGEDKINVARYHEIGRAVATIMSDEVFHDVAYKAKKREHLLAGIDEFLDAVTVLPPGEFFFKKQSATHTRWWIK